jgi:hypothetical protein
MPLGTEGNLTNFSHDNWCPGLESKRAPLMYKSEELLL